MCTMHLIAPPMGTFRRQPAAVLAAASCRMCVMSGTLARREVAGPLSDEREAITAGPPVTHARRFTRMHATRSHITHTEEELTLGGCRL